MDKEYCIVVETYDKQGNMDSRTEVVRENLKEPTHIKLLGLNHLEQIKLLQKVLDVLLPHQLAMIEEPEKCPLCGKRTRKQGVFHSHFHSVYTDHKVNLRRVTCTCGWKNKYTVEGKFGNTSHPDLLKMQSELGADHSFKKAELALKAKNKIERPINNHMHIKRLIGKLGPIISSLKDEKYIEPPSKPSKEIVAQTDGAHVQPKEKNKYGLVLLSDINSKKSPENGKLYVRLKDDDSVIYRVKGKNGETIEGKITQEDLGKTLLPVKNNIDDFKKIKQKILKVTSKREHTQKNKRSYEILSAKIYNLDAKFLKDKNHTALSTSTSVASGLLDNNKTIKRQILYAAKHEGMTENTIVYALSDGAKNCWDALSVLSNKCKKIITIVDWEHVGRKFKHAEQSLDEKYHNRIDRAKWRLWHGQPDKCLEKLDEIKKDFKDECPEKLDDLITYIKNNNNKNHFIHYEEYRKNGLPYTSNVIESSVCTLVNDRQKDNKKMSWSREGANNVLQIRASIASKTWENDWENAFEMLIAA